MISLFSSLAFVRFLIQNKDGGYIFVAVYLQYSLSVTPPEVCHLSKQRLELLFNDLDDVFVLHDVCEAHSLRAVLGTGSPNQSIFELAG